LLVERISDHWGKTMLKHFLILITACVAVLIQPAKAWLSKVQASDCNANANAMRTLAYIPVSMRQ